MLALAEALEKQLQRCTGSGFSLLGSDAQVPELIEFIVWMATMLCQCQGSFILPEHAVGTWRSALGIGCSNNAQIGVFSFVCETMDLSHRHWATPI